MICLETIKQKMVEAYEDSLRTYRLNQAGHADAVAVAFDAGRVDAFKQAMELMEVFK